MELDQLAAFERVAREGSFSRAALALGLGQPGVSGRIRALEASVGGALFDRGRRVSLTALGGTLLPYAQRALEVLREGREAARASQVGQRGRVRLGVLGSLAGGLVGPALSRFLRDRPEVECTLRAGDHEAMLGLLLDGLVDLALLAWPCSGAVAADLTPLFVFHEPVVLVAHPEHPLARLQAPNEADVARLARPLVQLRWWTEHHPRVTRLAQRAGGHVELSMEPALHLVLRGVGAGFFARTFVAQQLEQGTLVQVRLKGFTPLFRDSALVRRKRSAPLSPATAALVQELRREALHRSEQDDERGSKQRDGQAGRAGRLGPRPGAGRRAR